MAISKVWQQKVTAHAIDARRMLRSFVDNPGIVNGFNVVAASPASMAVNVQAGAAFVSESVSALAGTYHVVNDSTIGTFPITAANATLPRIDKVVLTIRDSFITGTNNDAIVQVITGSAAASPSAPATPANSIVLAHISVPAGATSITTDRILVENIRDVARMSYSLVPNAIPCRSTKRPTQDLIDGLRIYETDTGITRIYVNKSWVYLTGDVHAGADVRKIISQTKTQRKYWPVISAEAVVRAGVVQVNIRFKRARSDLSVPTSGNLKNQSIGTVLSPYRPAIAAMATTTSTGRMAMGHVNSAGNFTLSNVLGAPDIGVGYTFVMGFTGSVRDIYSASATA